MAVPLQLEMWLPLPKAFQGLSMRWNHGSVAAENHLSLSLVILLIFTGLLPISAEILDSQLWGTLGAQCWPFVMPLNIQAKRDQSSLLGVARSTNLAAA
jgi:hypothetical protein